MTSLNSKSTGELRAMIRDRFGSHTIAAQLRKREAIEFLETGVVPERLRSSVLPGDSYERFLPKNGHVSNGKNNGHHPVDPDILDTLKREITAEILAEVRSERGEATMHEGESAEENAALLEKLVETYGLDNYATSWSFPSNANDLLNKFGEVQYRTDKGMAVQVFSAIHARPSRGAFLRGPAGSGKTSMAHVMADVLGVPEIFFPCFKGTREDDIMVKLVPSEDTTSGVKQEPGPLLEAALISKRQPVILLIDEWDKTSPSADSFMLTFMQDGWLRYNGYRVRANLDNIIFFFAMNDQRELEEPFKRRLAHIEFTELPLQVVAQALVDTHPESEFIKPAVALYARSLMAKTLKPVTIQELRQLIDAIELLGDDADWDTLVYQFVTKSPDDHLRIKGVEGKEISQGSVTVEKRAGLSVERYTIDLTKMGGTTRSYQAALPRRHERKLTSAEKHDLEAASGALHYDSRTYTKLVELLDELPSDPTKLNGWELDQSGMFVCTKPIRINYLFTGSGGDDRAALAYWQPLFDQEYVVGEIAFSMDGELTLDDAKKLIRSRQYMAVSVSTDAVILIKESDGWRIEIVSRKGEGITLYSSLKNTAYSEVYETISTCHIDEAAL